jgi:hypothetical protein
MEDKRRSISGINALLLRLSQQQGWEVQLDLHSIFVNWQELLSSDITDHCQPLKIVKKVLWVEAENSVWLQQFQFQTVLLLEILNKSLRLSKLTGLRFCVAGGLLITLSGVTVLCAVAIVSHIRCNHQYGAVAYFRPIICPPITITTKIMMQFHMKVTMVT